MKIAWILFLFFNCYSAFCQSYSHIEESSSNPFLSDVNGRPLYLNTSYSVEGSPYFKDEYCAAQLTTINGRVFNDIKVKVNLLDRVIQYMASDGSEMITDVPIKKILFINFTTVNAGFSNVLLESFPLALNTKDAPVYEVLDNGKIKLLKKITVSYTDEKKYNDASITRIYRRKEIFCSMSNNGQERKLGKGKAMMLELFKDHRDMVSSFIDQYHLDCRTETSFKEIFKFYNNISL